MTAWETSSQNIVLYCGSKATDDFFAATSAKNAVVAAKYVSSQIEDLYYDQLFSADDFVHSALPPLWGEGTAQLRAHQRNLWEFLLWQLGLQKNSLPPLKTPLHAYLLRAEF